MTGPAPATMKNEGLADAAAATQEVAPNESQRDPKPLTSEGPLYEALFVAPWLQSRFGKGS
jgi:hypothetical protein